MRRRKILLISVGSVGLLIATALVVLFVMHSGSTDVGDGVGKTVEEVTTTSTADMPVILRPNVSRPSEAIQQELAHHWTI